MANLHTFRVAEALSPKEKKVAITAAVKCITPAELIGEISVYTFDSNPFFIPYFRQDAVTKGYTILRRVLGERKWEERLLICERFGLDMSYKDSPHHKAHPCV